MLGRCLNMIDWCSTAVKLLPVCPVEIEAKVKAMEPELDEFRQKTKQLEATIKTQVVQKHEMDMFHNW